VSVGQFRDVLRYSSKSLEFSKYIGTEIFEYDGMSVLRKRFIGAAVIFIITRAGRKTSKIARRIISHRRKTIREIERDFGFHGHDDSLFFLSRSVRKCRRRYDSRFSVQRRIGE